MNRLTALLVAVALCALALPARAYVTETSKWNPSTLPIPYHVNTSTLPSSIASTGVGSVDSAFATWGGPSCTSWRATNAGSTSTGATAGDGTNVISGSWPSDLGDVSSVIGVTTPVWSTSGGGFTIDADIRFNNVGFSWNTTGSGGVDTQSIATHEEGHFLGLDHTPVGGAIMYPSYGGGLVRALSSDDSAGVCFLYPSGVAPTDAGVGVDMGTSSDPCSGMASSCDTCTPIGFAGGAGCGWCGSSSQCIYSTSSGSPSSCSGGWVWLPMDCTGSTGGTGRFGDPCSGPTDCGSGAPCIAASTGATMGFCSQACADDCGCPGGYQCFSTSTAGLSVCAPGTNACSMPVDAGTTPVDMGTVGPPVDMGTVGPPVDMGTVGPPHDAGSVPTDGSAALDAGPGGHHTRTGGCCNVPGISSVPTQTGLASLALFAVLGVVRRTRRRR